MSREALRKDNFVSVNEVKCNALLLDLISRDRLAGLNLAKVPDSRYSESPHLQLRLFSFLGAQHVVQFFRQSFGLLQLTLKIPHIHKK